MPVKKIVFYVMCALLAIMIIISGITIGKAGALLQSILNPAPPAADPTISSTVGSTEDPTDTGAIDTTAPTSGTVDSSHEHSYTEYQTFHANCTEEGYTLYKCSCGDIETRDMVDALGHSYGIGKVIVSCTEEGYTKYECSRCGHIDKRNPTPAAGHKFDIEQQMPATCENDASIVRKCSNPDCTETETEFITGTSLGGHDYSILVKEVAATCTTDGYKVYRCANSGCNSENTTDKVQAEGHKFIEWFDSGDGKKTVCEKSNCNVSVHSSDLKITDQLRNDDGSYYVIEIGTKDIRRLYTYNIADNRSVEDRTQNPLDYSQIDLKQGLLVTYTASGGEQQYTLGFCNCTMTIAADGSASISN